MLALAGDDEALYRVGADGVAHVVRRLTAPGTTYEMHGAALSGGPHPTACVLWSAQHTRELWCYQPGQSKGRPVGAADPARDNRPDEIGAFAISADGTRLAWVDNAVDNSSQLLWTGDLTPSGLRNEQRAEVFDGAHTACGTYVAGLAWQDEDDLVATCSGDNDAAGGYARLHLPFRADGAEVPEHHASPYNEYRGDVSVHGSTAIGREGDYCEITCGDREPSPGTRAVRWDLTTGRVLDVLVVAAPERYVSEIWGGLDGLVYETSDGKEGNRLYVRLPGQRAGIRVTGLKEIDAAQP